MENYKSLLSTYRTEIKTGSFRGHLLRLILLAPIGVFLFVWFEAALTETLQTLVIGLAAVYLAMTAPFLWFLNGDAPFSGNAEESSSHFSFGFFSSSDDSYSSHNDTCHSSSDFSGGDSCGGSD
ncbi:hypothetical protein [Roseibium sp.]|uniref:hypothetical protein n=1 Tax=Roseibium sp. TaxID=1936156 RepID=UPI003BAF7F89